MKRYFILICFHLSPASLSSITVDEVIKNAVERDRRLYSIELNEIIRINSSQMENLTPPLTVSGGTGNVLLFEDEPLLMSPEASVTLASPLNTEVSVETTLTEGEITSTSLSITQPFNELLGLLPSENSRDILQQKDLWDYRINRYSRIVETEKEVLHILYQLKKKEMELFDQETEIRLLRNSLEEEVLLREISVGSSAYLSRELKIKSKERQNTLEKIKFHSLENSFIQLTGTAYSELTPVKEVNIPELPENYEEFINPELFLALKNRELQKERLYEAQVHELPLFSLISGIELTRGGNSSTLLSGGLSATYKGAELNAAYNRLNNKNNWGFSISWTQPDNRKKELNREQMALYLKLSELEVENARKDLKDSLALLKQKRLNLMDQEQAVKEGILLAELSLKETEKLFGEGYISPKEYESIAREREKLTLEVLLLNIEKRLFINEIKGILIPQKSI